MRHYAVGAESAVEINSAAWGRTLVEQDDLELLSEFTGLSVDGCVARLRSYRVEEMAAAWRKRNPTTPEEIRRFYAETDLYLWELLTWNGSEEYAPYLRRIGSLADAWPPSQFPRALDYGCGVGTTALRLSELGYQVTVADVPGRTFDFAKARLRRHGINFEAVDLTTDEPPLPSEGWDVITCFDVIEHVPDPAAIARLLVKALRRGGGAAIVASFDTEEALWPHHLAAGTVRFGSHRWRLFLQGLGMRQRGDHVYRKADRIAAALLKARYAAWKTTGFYVEYLPR